MEKFWTDAKIAETLKKDRVIKPISERRPKKYLTNKALSRLTSQKTGFVQENVREVVDSLTEVIWEQLLLGNKVVLPRVGSIFLTIAPPYKTNINLKGLGGKLKEHYVEPRFNISFVRNESSFLFLKQRQVSEEELNALYYDTSNKQIIQKEEEIEIEEIEVQVRKM